MRRRLHELLSDANRSGTDTAVARRRAREEPVPSAEGGSADADNQGTRSSESDPQRARSTGSTRRLFDTGATRGNGLGGRGSGGGHSMSDESGILPDDDAVRGDAVRGEAAHGEDRYGEPERDRKPKSSRSARAGRAARRVDPVAAGSEWDARETEAGESRSTPGRTPHGGTVEQAKDACLRLLAVRARSRAELCQRLAAKGFAPEIAESALHRLAEVGLVDDAAFAEQWVNARHTYSGKGRQALARELRRKGVAPSDAAAALAAVSDDDERVRAADLVRRKLRTMPRDLERDKALRRLVGMLARRGYSQSTAYTVVKAELGALDAADSPPDRIP